MEMPKDVYILFSLVNTKLRDLYPSPDALCDDLQWDRAALETALGSAGFRYDANTNRFVRG